MIEVSLAKGGYELGAAPQWGGAVTFLKHEGRDCLRPARSLAVVEEDPREAACFPCIPYFGRLYDGLTLDGKHWAQAPTLSACDPDYALHGEGWVSPWEIVSQTDNVLVCAYRHDGAARGRFPFAYEARQKIKLSDDGAEISLGLKNTGEASMPGGLGLHPYLPRRQDTVCAFTAKKYWTPPKGNAPGVLSYLPDALGVSRWAPLPAVTRDHSYAGFDGEATINTGKISLHLKTDAPILHLYAPEGENWYCMEPVTHLPGALVDRNNPYGGGMLAPGDTMKLTLLITAQ